MKRALGSLLAGLLLCACGADDGIRCVIVEEHHLAFAVWEEARARGEIEPGIEVVHFDAHEDLGEPHLEEPLPGPGEFEAAARADLTVDEVLTPALLNGTVGRFMWVTPAWLEEARPWRIRWVASRGGERKEIRVFGEEPGEEWPDSRGFASAAIPIGDVPTDDGSYVLDIDLDAFACENPHAGHTDEPIEREDYERLLADGRVRLRGHVVEDGKETESVVLYRPPGPFAWPVRLDSVRDPATGETRYVRGYMCMGEYRDTFPVHRPTDRELRSPGLGILCRNRYRPPALITIARSATSGIVPADRVDALETLVLETFRKMRDLWPPVHVERR